MLSSGSYCEGSTQYIAVKIVPKKNTNKSSFHLALLLDTSGSMEGDRLTALKRTLHLLVDTLRDVDRLTLISYNSAASILVNAYAISAESRNSLHEQIDTLVADGGTNLESAVRALQTVGGADSVFILTDGHINEGMVDTKEIQKLLQESVPTGTPVNTLGFGANHNAYMLRDMALNSCGTYTYADTDTQIPAIIGDILGGLVGLVGREAELQYSSEWTCLESQTCQEFTYRIGHLISEKPQWLVLSAPLHTPLPTLALTWKEGGLHLLRTYYTSTIPQVEVVAQRERCRVTEAFQRAAVELQHNRMEAARAILNECRQQILDSMAATTPLVGQLCQQLDLMIEHVAHHAPAELHSRMASGMATLTTQRGILSGGDPRAFSTPLQMNTSQNMSTRYTQETEEIGTV